MTKEATVTVKPEPLPDPPKDPFGAQCTWCKAPRITAWLGEAHIRVCPRCDRVDRWPVRSP